MKLIKSIDELKGMTNSKVGIKKQKKVLLPNRYEYPISDENIRLLDECWKYWQSLRDFRDRRTRCRKFYSGDQWSDVIYDEDSGTYMTEEKYIMTQGRPPIKQNVIRPLIKNFIGQLRSSPIKTIVLARARENSAACEQLTNALQCVADNNYLDQLDARLAEEFSISGAVVQKVMYRYLKERNQEDVYIENVNPNMIFFNSDVSDIRINDLRLIGEIIDTTIDDLVATFSQNEKQADAIRKIYSNQVSREYYINKGLNSVRYENIDFFIPDSNGSIGQKVRIYEIWYLKQELRVYAHDPLDGSYDIVPYTLQDIAEQNRERLRLGELQGLNEDEIPLIDAREKYEQFWYVKYLTPFGHCLYEGETPYKHQEHPYVVTLYPLLDGMVWGPVEDIIDQQKYINRLIMQNDFIMSASAKGLLMVPEDVVPDGMTPAEFAKEWVRVNGVIFYKPQMHGQIPMQITANSSVVGIHEALLLQLQFTQDIIGTHPAIQGKEATSGKPASLYAQEAQNATLNTLDYMATLRHFKQKRDTKILKTIVQYYNEKRYLAVGGKNGEKNSRLYDPELVKDLDFEVLVVQGSDTPVFRQKMDDLLFELLRGQFIDIEMFLENSSLPFAEKILEELKMKRESLEQGGTPRQFSPEIISQLKNESDPEAMKLINKALGYE